MSIKIIGREDACVSCEECIGCGRKRQHYNIYEFKCDKCKMIDEGVEMSDEWQLHRFKGMDLCPECLLKEWAKTKSSEEIIEWLLEFDAMEDIAKEFAESFDLSEVDE